MWGLEPDLATPLGEQLFQLARAHRILARNGHANMSLGHLSMRDPEGRGFWLKARGLGLEEVGGPGEFLLLDYDGNPLLEGADRRHGEWPIHAEIFRARPDVHVVAHTHPLYAASFSATQGELEAATAEGNFLQSRVAYYRKMPGLIVTPELGRELAETLDAKCVVLMKNHGVTTAAPNLAGAALSSIFIERACRVQLLLAASGLPWSAPPEGDLGRGGPARLDLSPALVDDFWEYFNRQLDREEPRG